MSTQKSVRQQADEVEATEALRLDQEKTEQLVEALNTDLAEDAEEAADEIAERAQALGGVPLAGGKRLEENAPVSPEGDDVYDIRTSLHNDMELYGDIIEMMREHIGLARGFGDHATAETLQQILAETEEHAHHIEHYLEDDTLVLESATN